MTAKEKKKNCKNDHFVSKAELYDYLISHYVSAQESVSSDYNAPAVYQLNVTISLPRSELTNIIRKDLIKKREKKWN